MPTDTVALVEAELRALLTAEPTVSLGAHSRAVDERVGLKRGSSLMVAKHALACRRWEVRLDLPIDGVKPLMLIRQA